MAPSRYANKFLQNSHYFLTSIFSPEEFWQGFGLSQKDTAKQFYRQLAEVWHISKDKITIYQYVDDEFKQVAVVDNPASQFLAKQKPTAPAISTQEVFQQVLMDIQQNEPITHRPKYRVVAVLYWAATALKLLQPLILFGLVICSILIFLLAVTINAIPAGSHRFANAFRAINLVNSADQPPLIERIGVIIY